MTREAFALMLILGGLCACGVEDADPGAPMAGTGSAGGNPLTFSFDVEDSEALSEVTWGSPRLSVGLLRVAHLNDTGRCVFDLEARLDASYLFPSITHQLPIHEPWPCALEIYPPAEQAMLEVEVQRPRSFTLRFFRDAGLRVDLQDPTRFEASRDLFVVMDLDRLLEGVDTSSLEALVELVLEDGQWRQRLVRNALEAVVIYLDPSPGDGTLSLAERTEANVLARFSLLGALDVGVDE